MSHTEHVQVLMPWKAPAVGSRHLGNSVNCIIHSLFSSYRVSLTHFVYISDAEQASRL